MYLARKKIKGITHYIIRESYEKKGVWRSRDLIDLGPDPTEYIMYPGTRIFYIREDLHDRLTEKGIEDTDELDSLLWPFVDPDIQYTLGHSRRSRKSRRRAPKNYYEDERLRKQIHSFDKRRFFFLKTGNIDLADINTYPMRYFRFLADKSRDEIEQSFLFQEMQLLEREYKRYVYASFNLQKFFARPGVRTWPEFVRRDELDEAFLNELCRMNEDRSLWTGMSSVSSLREYLQRYAVMFFDYSFGQSTYWDDYVRGFMNSHRFHKPLRQKETPVKEEEVDELFGEKKSKLYAMNKKELSKLYKRRAKKFHPDKGGDAEKFIRLTAIYMAVLKGNNQ